MFVPCIFFDYTDGKKQIGMLIKWNCQKKKKYVKNQQLINQYIGIHFYLLEIVHTVLSNVKVHWYMTIESNGWTTDKSI